jgi:hypothetical protein
MDQTEEDYLRDKLVPYGLMYAGREDVRVLICLRFGYPGVVDAGTLPTHSVRR